MYIDITNYVTSQSVRQKKEKKKKRKSKSQIFIGPHVPHLTQQSPTTHFHTIPFLSFGWPSLPSYFLFFLFFSLIHSSLSLAHPLPPIPPYHHPHHHFSGNVIRKFLGTSKHLHLLFEIKVSNLFDGFICFCLRLFLSKF